MVWGIYQGTPYSSFNNFKEAMGERGHYCFKYNQKNWICKYETGDLYVFEANPETDILVFFPISNKDYEKQIKAKINRKLLEGLL